MSYDARWQQVTCRRCGMTYTCTPGNDYYAVGDLDVNGPDDGVCFPCLLTENGMDPEKTPVMVIGEDGSELDPRDLALRMSDVTATRRPVLAGAYCTSGEGGNCFTSYAPDGDPDPGGFVRREGLEHTARTGHGFTVTEYVITDYAPAEVTA